MGDATVEPSALARAAARQLRDYYVALVQEGFTEKQALEIVIQLLRGQQSAGEDK